MKLIINMIVALFISVVVGLILKFLESLGAGIIIDEFMIGWISSGVFVFVLFWRKGSGLRLISEEKLQKIDKNL